MKQLEGTDPEREPHRFVQLLERAVRVRHERPIELRLPAQRAVHQFGRQRRLARLEHARLPQRRVEREVGERAPCRHTQEDLGRDPPCSGHFGSRD